MRRVLPLSLIACGRVWFDPRTDATSDACTTFGPWQPPVLIENVSSADDDFGPGLNPDGNLLAFDSRRAGSLDLYIATRTSPTSFTTPQPITALNTAMSIESGPAWSPAGDRLYFASDRTGMMRLYESSYDGTFGIPAVVAGLENEALLGPSARELELFMSDNMVVRMTTRASPADPWLPTQPVAELNAGPIDGFPTLSRDGLAIYFQSARGGSLQIYTASRPAIGQPFDTPTAVTELASGTMEDDPELAADGTQIIFGSQRPGGLGRFDLWTSQRACN